MDLIISEIFSKLSDSMIRTGWALAQPVPSLSTAKLGGKVAFPWISLQRLPMQAVWDAGGMVERGRRRAGRGSSRGCTAVLGGVAAAPLLYPSALRNKPTSAGSEEGGRRQQVAGVSCERAPALDLCKAVLRHGNEQTTASQEKSLYNTARLRESPCKQRES